MPVEFRNIEPPQSWQIFPRHPAGKDYAKLPTNWANRLKAGIEKYGIMLRSIILKREQNGLFILDGWQMYQACIAADVRPTFVEVVSGISAEELVEVLNDFRRHEDAKARAKRLNARKAAIREDVDKGMTIADAAKKQGVSKTTAQRDIAPPNKLNGTIVRCDRCARVNATGDDCARCQLLRMDVATSKEEPDPPEEPKPKKAPPAPPEPEKPALDANFVTIPEAALEAFEVACALTHECHELDGVVKRINKLLHGKTGMRAVSPTLGQRLADCRTHLWQARATYVCPYCQGRRESLECTACRGEGWLSAAAFAQAPKEFQDEMRKLGARNVPI